MKLFTVGIPIQCDGVGPGMEWGGGGGLDSVVCSIGGMGLHGPAFGRSSEERMEVLAGLGLCTQCAGLD
jgi:hypothetical protein